MLELIIAAFTKTKGGLGIGFQGKIPWYCPEDLKRFKELTLNKVCLVGRKTYDSLPTLKDRKLLVVTKHPENYQPTENVEFTKHFPYLYTFKDDFAVIGGTEIYQQYINSGYLNIKLVLTEIISDTEIECDTFLPEISYRWEISETSEIFQSSTPGIRYRFITFTKTRNFSNESRYLDLVQKILSNGTLKGDRTGVSTLSLFSQHLEFDLSNGNIPVFTTKRIPWKSAIQEMLFFLSGKCDTTELESKGIRIWEGNTSREFLDNQGLTEVPEGTLNFGYGHQIRHFGGTENCKGGFDQLEYIENLIETEPNSRRILWNLWNLGDLKNQTLPCCHIGFQVYINNNELSGHLTMRSNDIGLGNPFNVVGYSVLIHLLALRHHYKPGKLSMTMVDCHIYLNHVDQLRLQLKRTIRSGPVLLLNPELRTKDWNDMDIKDFDLVGYYPHPSIKMDMAI